MILALVVGLTLASAGWRQAKRERDQALAARRLVDAGNRRLKRDLFVREWQETENLLQQGKLASALTWFARAARNHPDDLAVANRLLSILSENTFAVPSCRPLEHGAAVTSCILTPDGRNLITAAGDGLVRIWPVGERGVPLVLTNQFHEPLVGFVPRDNRVVVADAEAISVWELTGARAKIQPARRVGNPRLA